MSGPTQTTNQSQNQSGTSTGATTGTSNLTGNTGPYSQATLPIDTLLSTSNYVPLQPAATGGQSNAIYGLQNAAKSASALNPQITGATQFLLGGGGVGNNTNYLTNASNAATGALNPYLGTSYLDPNTNPYLAPAITSLNDQITQQTKDAFGSAGRYGNSGDFTKALSTGLSSAELPLLLNQYNTNVGAQQGAANSLYNIGAGTTSGLDTSALQKAGVMSAAPSLLNSTYTPWQQALTAANTAVQTPWTNLGYASQFLTPLAQLGNTTNQTGTTAGTSTTQQNQSGTGTSTTTQSSDPWQTALGAGLGLLSLFG